MKYSIDRFEEGFAVLQDDNGECINVEKYALPADSKQGDIAVLKDGRWVKDFEETAKRRNEVLKLQQKLLNKYKNNSR